jgi:hypothetical protein
MTFALAITFGVGILVGVALSMVGVAVCSAIEPRHRWHGRNQLPLRFPRTDPAKVQQRIVSWLEGKGTGVQS